MSRRILFRRWNDPFLPLIKKHLAQEQDEEYHAAISTFDADEDREDETSSRYRNSNSPGNIGPCVVGPFGIVPMNESNSPSKMFNLWVGDTDFEIDDEVAFQIERTPGVDALDIFSRYSFRIAVGRAFNERVVKAAIEDAVAEKSVHVATREADFHPAGGLSGVAMMMARAHPFWAVVERPEGTECVGGKSRSEVEAKASKLNGKTVAASWEIK